MNRFTIQPTGALTPAGDPLFVNQQRDCDTSTAIEWTLHVRMASSDTGDDLVARIRQYGVLIGLKEITGGDRWAEWCEAAGDDEDRALHVYFSAPTGGTAASRSVVFCTALGLTDYDAQLTTAADWAEVQDLRHLASADRASSASCQHFIDTGYYLPESSTTMEVGA